MLKSQLNIDNYYEMNIDRDRLAGVDEVGRGALCGPVVAAAVILDPDSYPALITAGVRDSKKLSATERTALVPTIEATVQSYHIALATVAEIDAVNIRQANFWAMARAIQGLASIPHRCLVDGRDFIPNISIPQERLIQGDDRAVSIAAASILAKVYRDRLMTELATIYPEYDLAQNKGYGTRKHRSALQQHGATPAHRQSFLGKILTV
jgi:ribonuclease HII